MAKRYMGEGDPVLDALYEELNATGRKNRTDRRKRSQDKAYKRIFIAHTRRAKR